MNLSEYSLGKWAQILISLGYDRKYFTGRHTSCPHCEGKDRWRWHRQKEFGICNQCGTHQPADLAMSITGLDFIGIRNKIIPNIGQYKMEKTEIDDIENNRKIILNIHKGLKKIQPGDLASKYFISRGINILPEKNCYFHPGYEYIHNGNVIWKHPLIVSVFRNTAGDMATYHMTLLDDDGNKANTKIPKLMCKPVISLPGCAIRLFEPERILCVCEGLETALSVYQTNFIPTWACGSAELLKTVKIPEIVKTVWIYADSDANFTGQAATYFLANRLIREGKTVRVVLLINKEHTEDFGVKFDYNDLINNENDKS